MELLQARFDEGKSVCVGLDPDWNKIVGHLQRNLDFKAFDCIQYLREIVKATYDLVCAFKPNLAFFEQYGADGIRYLQELISDIHLIAPGVPVIADAKRGDIGNTNAGYIGMLDYLGADAITLHPYMGKESLKPFLDRADKGCIILCRTSNLGAGEFQNISALYEMVASKVAKEWNGNGNCALVAGATYPEELKRIREIAGDIPLLIPGIGAQGGDLEATVRAGANSKKQGMIINASRSVLYASKKWECDFERAARLEVQDMDGAINKVLAEIGVTEEKP